jgi:hypothetical protein
MRAITVTLAAVIIAFAAVAAKRPAAMPPAGKTILFLAGPKDHGIAGRHEYEKDLRTLAQCLESSPNLKGVATKVVVGRAPRDLAEYQDVAAIVIESSSDRDEKETHPLFPPEPTTTKHTYDAETLQYLKDLDALVKQGMGVAIIHYASWVEHWVARRRSHPGPTSARAAGAGSSSAGWTSTTTSAPSTICAGSCSTASPGPRGWRCRRVESSARSRPSRRSDRVGS